MESNSQLHLFKSQDDMEVDMQFDKSHETEICRIISQYLQEKGFHESAQKLQEESGVYLEGAMIQNFRKLVLEGNYDEVVKLIHEIECDSHSVNKVKQAIYEQKYFELLEQKETQKALE